MDTLRHFFRDRPSLAALLLAAALCLKVFVPAGYMPTAQDSGIVITLCSGSTMTVAVAQDIGQGHKDAGSTADHPCAFAPLGADILGAVLPALLLAALAFVFVAAITRQPLVLRALGSRIRPPSQGPPRFI